TALLDLSEIAARKGNSVRAEEFIESAFEVALAHESEARALELALKERGRVDLLARALEARLNEELPASDAARALANLVGLTSEGHVHQLDNTAIAARTATVMERLQSDGAGDF